jgi:hypothetical protein
MHKRKFEDVLFQQPSSSNDDVWKKDLETRCPAQSASFLWRVINEYMPTRQILFRKHVEPLQFCEVCGFLEESIKHVLLDALWLSYFGLKPS